MMLNDSTRTVVRTKISTRDWPRMALCGDGFEPIVRGFPESLPRHIGSRPRCSYHVWSTGVICPNEAVGGWRDRGGRVRRERVLAHSTMSRAVPVTPTESRSTPSVRLEATDGDRNSGELATVPDVKTPEFRTEQSSR